MCVRAGRTWKRNLRVGLRPPAASESLAPWQPLYNAGQPGVTRVSGEAPQHRPLPTPSLPLSPPLPPPPICPLDSCRLHSHRSSTSTSTSTSRSNLSSAALGAALLAGSNVLTTASDFLQDGNGGAHRISNPSLGASLAPWHRETVAQGGACDSLLSFRELQPALTVRPSPPDVVDANGGRACATNPPASDASHRRPWQGRIPSDLNMDRWSSPGSPCCLSRDRSESTTAVHRANDANEGVPTTPSSPGPIMVATRYRHDDDDHSTPNTSLSRESTLRALIRRESTGFSHLSQV